MARFVATITRVSCVVWLVASAACERGDASRESCDPSVPESCAAGWACRGGVCVRFSTPVEPPSDPAPPVAPDAGAAGDAQGGDAAVTDATSQGDVG